MNGASYLQHKHDHERPSGLEQEGSRGTSPEQALFCLPVEASNHRIHLIDTTALFALVVGELGVADLTSARVPVQATSCVAIKCAIVDS